MTLTKIGASLGSSADTILVTQSNSIAVGRPVRIDRGTDLYAYANSTTPELAEAVGIVIERTNATMLIALSGRVTVNACLPNGATPGTVLYLNSSNDTTLVTSAPTTAGYVVKPMAVVTVTNSEMILINYREEVNSSGAASIADNAITNAKMADDAINTDEILDNAVTLDKMQHGTAGDILYYNASGVPTRLNKPGSPAGEVLTYASSATIPSWTAPAATGATIVEVYKTSNETIVHTQAEVLDWQAAQTQLLNGSANTTQWTSSNASKLICKSAGVYVVHAFVTWSSAGTYGSGSGEVNLKIYKNRSDSGGTIGVAGAPAIHAGRYSQELTRTVELAVDDYVEVQVYHSTQTGGSGTQVNRNIESFKDTGAGPTRDSPYFSMYKL